MAKIVVKSAKFGIVVKELDTANYQDSAVLIRDLLQAIPDADWFEERSWQIGPTFAPSRISTSFDQPSIQRHPVAEEKGVLGEKSAPLYANWP